MIPYKLWLPVLFVICLGAIQASAQQADARYPIIPYPTGLIPGNGTFVITPATLILLPIGGQFKAEAAMLNRLFINSFGKALKQSPIAGKSSIRFNYDPTVAAEEGYQLDITARAVTISARTSAGMFMAVQTIRQMLPATVEKPGIKPVKSLSLPVVNINDEPAFAWRGMHLDVARHFFSIAYLKRFIDVLALYKFNKLHLHLTDDEGWRIEIKKYPKLTENGAWRPFIAIDSNCMKRAVDNPDLAIDPTHIIQKDGKTLYGGFYTQAEMKALVAYAADRHIDIVPELDMPGHMMTAINQYPYLSCEGGSSIERGFSSPICPCMPTTFQFAEDVYTEIMDIFPSRYIHIGGDEVDRSKWAKSAECNELMKKENIKTTAELQSYFINHMEGFFNSKGRKLVGWDEILEGGVTKNAVIMYWRGWVPKAPVDAAKNGNQVVMSPGSPLYFDAIPDKNSIPAVYNFDPIPKGLTPDEAKNIIGAQANIWTEYIPGERRADYMYMPRMTALAEVLWTNHPDYPSYQQRLTAHYSRLDRLNVHYRLPDLSGFLESNVFVDQDTLYAVKPLPDLSIRYTIDGTSPNATSTIMTRPLIISQNQKIRLAAFRTDGSRGDVYDLNYEKQTLAEPEKVREVKDGLICRQYRGFYKMTTSMTDDRLTATFKVDGIVVPHEAEAPSFGLKYRGYLDIPADGIYSFYLTCDDGGVLKIARRMVVDNDGLHSAIEKNGQVALKKGLQNFALDFIEGGGGYKLQLKYSVNGSEPRDIPASWFKN